MGVSTNEQRESNLNSETEDSSLCPSSSFVLENPDVSQSKHGTEQLRDNRALFAAENVGPSRTKHDDELWHLGQKSLAPNPQESSACLPTAELKQQNVLHQSPS
jgi:hypothetical protein